jgi:hypothetical protein
MNAVSRSSLTLALLAAASACNQPSPQANKSGEEVNAENLFDEAVILNDTAVGNELSTVVSTPEPAPAAAPPQAKPKAVRPKIAPKPPSPPANPNAGHDMGNMSDAEMKNMSH